MFQGIYQLFYKDKSASDKGSLHQLRNLISRRTVTGADNVTRNYRSHYQFIEIVTDAYIIGAFLDRFYMDNMTSKPSEIPVFSLMTDKEKVDWVAVLDHLQLSKFDSLDELSEKYKLSR